MDIYVWFNQGIIPSSAAELYLGHSDQKNSNSYWFRTKNKDDIYQGHKEISLKNLI